MAVGIKKIQVNLIENALLFFLCVCVFVNIIYCVCYVQNKYVLCLCVSYICQNVFAEFMIVCKCRYTSCTQLHIYNIYMKCNIPPINLHSRLSSSFIYMYNIYNIEEKQRAVKSHTDLLKILCYCCVPRPVPVFPPFFQF